MMLSFNGSALSQVQLVSALTRCDSDCFYAQALSLEPLLPSKPRRAAFLPRDKTGETRTQAQNALALDAADELTTVKSLQ